MNVLDDFPRSRHYDTDPPLWEVAHTGQYRGLLLSFMAGMRVLCAPEFDALM